MLARFIMQFITEPQNAELRSLLIQLRLSLYVEMESDIHDSSDEIDVELSSPIRCFDQHRIIFGCFHSR